MKHGWYKCKKSGVVVFCEGVGQCERTVVVRDRYRALSWLTRDHFADEFEPIKASGFPPVKPKTEFKPRYATYHLWSEGEAFVQEFEPGKFKVVMKDGGEVVRPEAWKYFKKFFEEGSWTVVSEEEALARLDKPKAPVPAAEQFGPGPWYGGGLTYRQASFQTGYGFYVFTHKTKEHVGWVSYEVVRSLWDLNMVSKERPRTEESIVGKASEVLDAPVDAAKVLKTAIDLSPELWEGLAKKPKKLLVEWAVPVDKTGYHSCELWPEGATPVFRINAVKTGRTVEVPQ